MMEKFERELDELFGAIVDNKDEIDKLQLENDDMKAKALKIMEDNFITAYMTSDRLIKGVIYAYSKDLLNKEKCEKLLADLQTGKADVDSIKMSDMTKESKIKFIKVAEID